ncbi:MAG TPA: glycerol dehydrogenase [Candidatus Methylomirabilis sp.]|nr:glycerol dehydrogenase [Candidatus Methylomirabilis sp.]
MAERLPMIFAAPGTYVQAQGILKTASPHLARLGARIFGVVDPNVWDDVEPALAEACRAEGLAWRAERFPGECTEATVATLVEAAKGWDPAAIVAAGGGKSLDTGKLMAESLRLPSAMVPTIASTDAPTSRVAVLYDDNHVQVRVARLRANPALVLVDTAVIVKAPVRFLVAGMGDAISTWPEARANVAGAARTPLGGSQARAALALAELCYRLVLEHGRQARADAQAKRVSPAFEAIVEANTLLSGLGFESGGLAACHGLYAGLSALPAGAAYMHGEKVAFGVVVQSILENWPQAERAELLGFYRDVGLPATLAAIGLKAATEADLRKVAEITCRPGNNIHNMSIPVTADKLVRVLESLRD